MVEPEKQVYGKILQNPLNRAMVSIRLKDAVEMSIKELGKGITHARLMMR